MDTLSTVVTPRPPVNNLPCDREFAWTRPFLVQNANWIEPLKYEYYDCEIESLASDRKFDLVARRGIASPCPVTLLSSRRRYAFWRSWNHISDNKENLVMLRYVKSGVFFPVSVWCDDEGRRRAVFRSVAAMCRFAGRAWRTI